MRKLPITMAIVAIAVLFVFSTPASAGQDLECGFLDFFPSLHAGSRPVFIMQCSNDDMVCTAPVTFSNKGLRYMSEFDCDPIPGDVHIYVPPPKPHHPKFNCFPPGHCK